MFEPYPKGSSNTYSIQSTSDPSSMVQMCGTFISVPIPACNSCIPTSDTEVSPYVVHLVGGFIHQISPDNMEHFVVSSSYGQSNTIHFPSWLGNHQQVLYLHEGVYVSVAF
jgi:hypothetical protein